MNGFGDFENAIQFKSGYLQALLSLTLNVQNNSGTWSDASQVLERNTNGHLAAAMIYVQALPTVKNPHIRDGLYSGLAADTLPIGKH